MSSKTALDPEKQEPKENDKCMETANSDKEESEWRKRLGDFSKRTKDFASNRYKVVLAILCVLLFIFFIIIIALAVKIGTIQSAKDENYCNSDKCLHAAANVVSKMNDTLDPCNDFYEYSCGHWATEQSRITRYGIIEQVQDEIYKRERHMLDLVSSDVNEHSPRGKAKLFFSACMKTSDIKFWSLSHFKRWIVEIGGWGILDQSPSFSWNRHDVLLRLHVNYGVHPFFKFAVSKDDKNPGKNIIKISPFGLGLPDRSYYFISESSKYVRAYKDFIKDIIREFGSTPTSAVLFAEAMYNYEKRIAQISPIPERALDVNENYEIITIHQLRTIAPTVKWLELLQSYYPTTEISTSTEVAILYKDYFSRLSGLLSTTDDPSLNNYMMWHMVLHYLPHFPNNFTVIANRFYQTLEGVHDTSIPKEERWEFCMKQTTRYLGHALSSMYVEKYFNEAAKSDIQQTVDNILTELSGKVNSIPWLRSSDDKEMVQEKIRLLKFFIGYPEFIQNDKKLESYYKSFQVKATTHIENIHTGENFLREKEEELLNQPYHRNNNSQNFAVDVEAIYNYAGNSLVIPAGLLNLPIYDHRMPEIIKYGSIAGYISNKLMQMLDIRGINYEKNGVLQPWLSNRSRELYAESTDCLLQNIVAEDPKLHSNLTAMEIMNEIGSVKYSYLAFKRVTNEGFLPGINKNQDQIFFMAYAQSLCQISQPEKVTVWNDPKYGLKNKLRVINALRQLPEFISAFSCPEDSVMKSKTQCDIW